MTEGLSRDILSLLVCLAGEGGQSRTGRVPLGDMQTL